VVAVMVVVVVTATLVAAVVCNGGRVGGNDYGGDGDGSGCEIILHGYLYDGDLVFVILKRIHGFKFHQKPSSWVSHHFIPLP
jgi:hypothetical protein